MDSKSTSSASPKKVIKTSTGLLIAKVPGLEILHLKQKNKKIQGKGGLPTDWSRGLDSYTHVKGGTAAMSKVKSKSKNVTFTLSVSTPAQFDLKEHLTGVSIDLEGDNLLFEAKSLKGLEDRDDLIVLFGYASALEPEYCSKSTKWVLSKALTEQRGEPTPAPEIDVILNYPPNLEYKPFKKDGPKPK